MRCNCLERIDFHNKEEFVKERHIVPDSLSVERKLCMESIYRFKSYLMGGRKNVTEKTKISKTFSEFTYYTHWNYCPFCGTELEE